MNRKLFTFTLLTFFLVFSILPYMAQADGKGKGCSKGLDDKIIYKAMAMIKSQEELGLSDEQVAKIKDLKYGVKKELVKKTAEIDILKIDIKAMLYGDTVDVAAIDPLIDKKYEIKKAKAKYLVAKYAELKDMLTEEQTKELKTLCKASKYHK